MGGSQREGCVRARAWEEGMKGNAPAPESEGAAAADEGVPDEEEGGDERVDYPHN